MKRIAVFGATLGLLLSLFPAVALAETVPTQAEINPAGTPPSVLYKFEVPDADPTTFGIQYVGDDAADFESGAQIAPNLEDQPEVQKIAYWWVATDPNGIDDIVLAFVRAFHPDGTLKYQLHAAGPSDCSALGTWSTPGTPLSAAYLSGQLTTAEADAIVENCTKHMWVPFMAIGEISKHQPAGSYRVVASVSDQAGNVAHLTNFMDILPVVGLEIDFAAGVNFGLILPNTAKWVRGDTDMGTPVMPTVKNTGNVNMYLALTFSDMVGLNYLKKITSFDAQLNAQKFDPFPAGTQVCFTNEPLGSNVEKQLDLSIHPGSVPADIYNGTLAVSGGPSCP